MSSDVQTLQLNGKKFVVVAADEYRRLIDAAFQASDGPPLPTPDANGHVPAIEYGRASLARKVIARRKKAGWTVEQLARKAKVRVDVIRNLERGESSPSVAAVDRIDRALRAAKA
jgi:DNA-binding XRE family transcriptional regulator